RFRTGENQPTSHSRAACTRANPNRLDRRATRAGVSTTCALRSDDGTEGWKRADHFVGTRAFNSSNQFKTTCISGGAAEPDKVFSRAETTPRIRFPSSMMSLFRSIAGPGSSKRTGTGAGTPKLKAGFVVTLTLTNWPGPGA